MRKGFLLLVLFIFFFYNADAKTLAYDNWISNTKGFSLDGKEFIVLVTENGNSILLKTNAQTKSIDLNECIEIDYNDFCLNDSSYVKEDEDYKAHVYVYYLEPSFNVALSSSKTDVMLGDDLVLTSIIENDGDTDSLVTFTSEIPEELEIINIENAEKKQNSVYWQGIIKKGESREVEYKVKSAGELDKYIISKLSYFDGFKNQEVFSDALRVYTTPVFSYSLVSNKDDYEIGEDAVFTFAMQNKGEKNIKVDYVTFVYSGIAEIKEAGITKSYPDEFTWSGTLEEGNYKNLTFKLVPGEKQTYLVSVFGKYTYDTKAYSIKSLAKNIETDNKGIAVNISISKITVKSGEPVSIIVKATNRNSFLNISKAKLIVKTDIANFENTTHGNILPNQTALLLNNEIIAPSISSDKSYSLVFNVTYYTENGEIYSEESEKTIEVISEKKLEINPTLSPESINEEEVSIVTVNIKNPGQEDIKDAKIRAIIPQELTIKGPSSGYLTISAGEEQAVLTFTLYPDIVMEEKNYILNFTASYTKEDKEFLVSAAKNLLVSPKKPKLSISKSLTDSGIHQGQIVDVTYTISNEDTVPVYDIFIEPSKSQEFDTLNTFNINISKLEPGEKSVLKAEQLRTKRSGTFGTGSSVAYFKDKIGRSFNVSSDSLDITVSESKINGPAVYITQEINETSVTVGDEILIAINITNIGSSFLTGNLEGFGEIKVNPGAMQQFQKKIPAASAGTIIIHPVQFYYYIFNNKARSYSNQVEIIVINKTEVIAAEIIKEVPEAKEQEIIEKPAVEEKKPKKSFFANIVTWFLGLFKKV